MAVERAKQSFNIEIFVVDNASVDGSQAMVKKKFPFVHFIENHKNLGFSKANNQALKLAKGRYILFLNPDTLIQEDTIVILKKFLDEHPRTAAVGCKLINPDGTFQIASRRGIPTPWVAFTRIAGLGKIFAKSRLFGQYNLTYLDPDLESEIDVLSGSLMMVRNDILNEIGYFDECYFMYGEDIDLCYRIKKAGWQIFYTPKTKAIHYKGESTKKGEFPFVSHFYSAMLIFINKHFNNRYSIFLKIILTMGIYTRAYLAYFYRFLRNISSLLLDLLFIILSIFLAIKIWLPHYSLERFRAVFPIYTAIWLISIYLSRAYHHESRYRTKPITSGSIIGLLLNSTFTYFFKQFAYSRVVVLISFLLILLCLSLWRLLYRLVGPYAIRHPLSRLRRAIIVGSGKEGARILKRLRKRPDIPFEVCGFVDFDEKNIGKEIDGTETLATIENIRDVIRVERVDDVIFSSDRMSNAQILETIANAQGSGVSFRIVPHELEYIVAKSSVNEIDSGPMLDFINIYDPLDLFIKRLGDIISSLLIIIFTLPFFLFNLLIGTRLTKKRILTEHGELRDISFFDGGLPFLKNLPLYFSVLNGILSIVGSEIITESDSHRPVYKPGITGLVQIKSKEKKKTLTQQEKDYYDLYFLRHRSVTTDLQIILKSLF